MEEPSPEAFVTLADLMKEPTLRMELVVAPDESSVRRRVSWVHATEQVDPRPHLRSHELVCTLGSALVRRRSAETFVSVLAETGVAGVALGLGEVHLEPPRELLDACAEHAIPLILLPHGVPFRAVHDVVLRRRAQLEDEARTKESVLLSKLLTMARSGHNRAEILDAANAETPRGTASRLFAEQLQSILELAEVEHSREAAERHQQLGQLIDLVAGGLAHPAAIRPELQSRGLDIGHLRASSWPLGSEGVLAATWPDGLIGTTSNAVILISDGREPVAFRELGLVCGYSGVAGLGDLRRLLSESASALRLARSRGGVAGPEMLVSFDALLEQQPADRLAPYIEHLITPLVRADETGRGELMRTLTTFFDNDGHLRVTADALGVHVNTIRYRLAKIRDLVGRDALTLDGGVDLRIGLWALNRRRVLGGRMIRPLPGS